MNKNFLLKKQSNYYGKKNNKFIDVDTGDYLNLSDSDIELYANNLSSFFQ